MRDVNDVSKISLSISGYPYTINSGDEEGRRKSLLSFISSENHLVPSIIPDPVNKYNHDPSLRISRIFPQSFIAYTLDGSTPIPSNSGTYVSSGDVILPLQDAEVYYREIFPNGTGAIMGSLGRFHLLTDWIELSQSKDPYNFNGKLIQKREEFTYSGATYTVDVASNLFSPGFTYPKTIDCNMRDINVGCPWAPYEMYTKEHEQRLRMMVKDVMERYIDSPEYRNLTPSDLKRLHRVK